MRLTKRGLYRDCGTVELAKERDLMSINRNGDEVTLVVQCPRKTGVSYEYQLTIKKSEILEILLGE